MKTQRVYVCVSKMTISDRVSRKTLTCLNIKKKVRDGKREK